MRIGILHLWCVLQHMYFGWCQNSFSDVLHHYEILNPKSIQHKIVRRSVTEEGHVRHISFEALETKFLLDMKQSSDILTSDFKALQVDHNGRSTEAPISRSSIYKGHLYQQFDSTILLHIDDNGLMTGLITTKDEIYHIEPSWRHIENDNHMIIYRETDVRSNVIDRYTRNPSAVNNANRRNNKQRRSADYTDYAGHFDTILKLRSRRDSACSKQPPTVCTLYLVADYLYFKHVGGSNYANTILYMLQAITIADKTFRKTDWKSNDVCYDIGFTVKEAIVYKFPSNSSGPRFNQPLDENSLKNDQILRYIINEPGIRAGDICLGHLFTYRDFAGGMVGQAYIRSAGGDTGICSKNKVALSSNLNFGRPLLTVEANLVTVHELAHNFGANHDGLDGSNECVPGEEIGNYLMYDRMLSGELSNNKILSPCSIKEISSLLKEEPPTCLVPRNGTLCGNGIVEVGEQCDGGIIKEEDPCCTKDCRLKSEEYNCSDINHICCTNCSFSTTTKMCRNKNEFNCTDVTFCDGKSANCPDIYNNLTDNSPCNFGGGNCQKDGCVDVCKQKGMTICYCDATDRLCFICCFNETTDVCSELYLNKKLIKEANGALCDHGKGLCFDGKCQPRRKNVQDEFKSLLEDFSFSKLGRFLKANIVGTILTFSLFIWFPASCIVHLLDKQHDEEEYLIRRWMHPNNAHLLPKQTNVLKGLFKKNPSEGKRVTGSRFHISS